MLLRPPQFRVPAHSGAIHKLQGLSWIGAQYAWSTGDLRWLNTTTVYMRDLSDLMFYQLYDEARHFNSLLTTYLKSLYGTGPPLVSLPSSPP